MATIADLAVGLHARTQGFVKPMLSASRVVGTVASSMAAAATTAATFGAALGAVAAGGLALLTKNALGNIDSTAKLADRIGVATEDLVAFRHAAELTGAGSSTLDKGLEQLTRRLGEARTGTGLAKRSLDVLGLSADKLAAASPAEAFKLIADRTANLATQADKAQVAYNLFGRQGLALINTLDLGREGLDEVAAEADKLGISFSRVDAAQVEAANDAITRLQALFRGVGQQLAIKLAPFLEATVERMIEWGTSGEGAAQKVITGLKFVFDAVKSVARFVARLQIRFEQFGLGVASWAAALTEGTRIGERFQQTATDIAGRIGDIERGVGTWEQSLDNVLATFEEIRRKSREQATQVAAKRQASGPLIDVGALERQEEAMRRIEQRAKSVFEQTRSPLEQFTSRMAELVELTEAGAITFDTFERAVRQAREQLDAMKQAAQPTTAAVRFGSAEAFSAERVAAVSGNARDGSTRSLEAISGLSREQLVELRRMNEQLAAINNDAAELN